MCVSVCACDRGPLAFNQYYCGITIFHRCLLLLLLILLHCRLCLREYCIEVLRSAYNTLVRQVRRVLERNAGSSSHDDSYLLWAIRFFMEFNRLSGLQLQLVRWVKGLGKGGAMWVLEMGILFVYVRRCVCVWKWVYVTCICQCQMRHLPASNFSFSLSLSLFVCTLRYLCTVLVTKALKLIANVIDNAHKTSIKSAEKNSGKENKNIKLNLIGKKCEVT